MNDFISSPAQGYTHSDGNGMIWFDSAFHKNGSGYGEGNAAGLGYTHGYGHCPVLNSHIDSPTQGDIIDNGTGYSFVSIDVEHFHIPSILQQIWSTREFVEEALCWMLLSHEEQKLHYNILLLRYIK